MVHVLIDCPQLREMRQELRRKAGSAFNNVSEMLGGAGPQGKEGRLKDAAQDSFILGAVI